MKRRCPGIPAELQDVIGTVNLNAGANLNLRDRPTADGRVVVGIPSGDSMVINGRSDGTCSAALSDRRPDAG